MGILRDFFVEEQTNGYDKIHDVPQEHTNQNVDELKEYMYAVSNNSVGVASNLSENVSFKGKFALVGAGLGLIYGIVKGKNLFITIGASTIIFSGSAYLITNIFGRNKNKAVAYGNGEEDKYRM